MSKSTGSIREGFLVTLTVMIVMVVAFFLYFMMFGIIERSIQDNYAFVPKLRAGYGFVWLLGVFYWIRQNFRIGLKQVFFQVGLPHL